MSLLLLPLPHGQHPAGVGLGAERGRSFLAGGGKADRVSVSLDLVDAEQGLPLPARRCGGGVDGFAPKTPPVPPAKPALQPKKPSAPATTAADVRQQITQQIVNAAPALIAANPGILRQSPSKPLQKESP